MRKDEVHLELNLAKDVNDSKKGFFKYTNTKRKTKGNVGPLLNGAATLVTEDAEKAEAVKGFLA